jgi:hypothetical protein
MKKTRISKDTLVFAVFTLITVFVWMATDIYRALNKSRIPKILSQQIAPLNPRVDRVALDQLESKLFFSSEEVTETLKEPLPSPEPTQTEEIINISPDQATESSEASEN